MGKPVVNEPHYPVINASPTWGAIIRNWSLGDYAQLITYTVAGGIVGFAGGKPVRRQGSIYLAGIGAFLSITASCRGSFYRLRGIWENQGECAARGIPFPATN